jgi:hypothetical protein
VLHYEFYKKEDNVPVKNDEIQCIVSRDNIPFGVSQKPGLFDYADQTDTMQFLLSIG